MSLESSTYPWKTAVSPGKGWKKIPESFVGNTDGITKKLNCFGRPVLAFQLKIMPLKYILLTNEEYLLVIKWQGDTVIKVL